MFVIVFSIVWEQYFSTLNNLVLGVAVTMSFNEWRKVIFRQCNGKVKSLLESDDDFPGCQHVSYY